MNRWALLCSGQGCQSPEMFARFDDEASQALFRERIAPLPEGVAARFDPLSEEGLSRGEVAQPAMALYSELAWKALRRAGLPLPDLLLGYSLGELNAMAVSGALPWEEWMPVAVERARLMAAAWGRPTALVATLGLDRAALAAIGAPFGAAVAIEIGPQHLIIGLERTHAAALTEAALAAGATTCRVLHVEVASHTPFLAAAGGPFGSVLERCEWGRFAVPLLSATSLGLVRTRREAVKVATAQLSGTVRWGEAMEAALERGITIFLELGPGRGLTKIARELAPEAAARSLADFQTFEGAVRWVEKQVGR
ncbi:MAG TPA: acyltransferase domain-containing protein [Chthoniobacteraceae bacterium]|nr:acyltransferase domain-containing protein [Chthoniobacteraceae bacterium]